LQPDKYAEGRYARKKSIFLKKIFFFCQMTNEGQSIKLLFAA